MAQKLFKWKASSMITLMASMIFLMICVNVFAQIEVGSADELQRIIERPDGDYVQTRDIDLRGVRWRPIGDRERPFVGTYDGRGYKIINLELSDGNEIGLFGHASGRAQIRDVGLENVRIDVRDGDVMGSLVGMMMEEATVLRCYASGSVNGRGIVGGLVGMLRGGGIIDESYFAGSVSPQSDGGGLLGANTREGNITRSYSVAVVSGEEGRVGGLVGFAGEEGRVRDSYWDVDVSGQGRSQGGEPRRTAEMVMDRTFEGWDFRETWSIGFEGAETYPWLTWQRRPGEHNFPPAAPLAGPRNLSARAGNRIVDLTWNAPTEGEVRSYRVYRNNARVGETAANILTFRDQNLNNGTQYSYYVTAMIRVDDREVESERSNTVQATPNLFGEGDGTAANPYRVSSAEQLDAVRQYLNNANVYFRQTDNIDMRGINWDGIGTAANNSFNGKYDGGGFEIRNLNINAGTAFYRGLFRYVGNGALLENIHLVDAAGTFTYQSGGIAGVTAGTSSVVNCSVTGAFTCNTNFYFGGLLGYVSGGVVNVTNCWTDVTMSGAGYQMGGLIGYYAGTGTVSGCYASGDVSSTNGNASLNLGGLIGNLGNGSVTNCYATGSVTSTQNKGRLGGFVGYSTRPLTNCFSAGEVTSIGPEVGGFSGYSTGATNNCFWNVETSQQTMSGGAEQGKSTFDMLQEDTYAGWDFANTWSKEELSYPYLAWEGEEAGEHSFPPLTVPPSNVTAVTENRDVNLTWTAPVFIEAEGYKVYRNEQLISGDELVRETRFRDEGIEDWVGYTYTVKAVYDIDDELIESSHSVGAFVVLYDYEAGDGTPGNPFEIARPIQLDGVRNFQRGHFILVDDINLDVEPWNEDGGWEPLFDALPGFMGSLDGNGFEITGMTINRNTSDYQGLFGYTTDATLKNIKLRDIDLRVRNYSGGLIGESGGGLVENCSATGSIAGSQNIGGLVGNITGGTGDTFVDSWTDVEVTSNSTYVGGFIGRVSPTINFINCHALGDVTTTSTVASSEVGGFGGYVWMSGQVRRCYATGNVTSGGGRVGGLFGVRANGSNYESYATGNVRGTTNVGGFAGQYYTSTTYDCYATGAVDGTNWVGGYAGQSTTTLYRCYAVGRVSGQTNVGGLTGFGTGVGNNSYWNVQTTGQETSATGTAVQTTAEMKRQATFAGFDFNNTWSIIEDVTYPYLIWERGVQNLVAQGGDEIVRLSWEPPVSGQPIGYKIYRNNNLISGDEPIDRLEYLDEGLVNYTTYNYGVSVVDLFNDEPTEFAPTIVQGTPIDLEGSGTEESPFLIRTASNFNNMRYALNAHFRQEADIDLSDYPNWTPIGTANNTTDAFTGVYDGNGYEIRNLSRTGSLSYFGVFNYSQQGAVFENVKLRDINVYGNSSSGTLVAYATGTTFRNCSVTGKKQMINATQGGIVGYTTGNSSFYRCWANIEMVDNGSAGYAGGIVGQHGGTGPIEECYAIIDIASRGSNNPAASGLVGRLNNGSVDNCYAFGTIRAAAGAGTAGQYAGLVGYNTSNRQITNSYAVVNIEVEQGLFAGLVYSGTAANVSNSYWNREATGLDVSPGGGEARTTGQMISIDDEDTYVGWDFDDVWTMVDGLSYPWFQWQGEAPKQNIPGPINLQAQKDDAAQEVHLTWDMAGEPAYYNIYRQGVVIGDVEHGETLEYLDTDVPQMIDLNYSVSAVYIIDEEEIETSTSNVVTVRLMAQFAGGNGTADNPYQINSAGTLSLVREHLGAHFKLVDDIDLGVSPWCDEEGWMPIGNNVAGNRFRGSLDGNNHIISGLTINRPTIDYQGLFGYTEAGAVIKSVGLKDVNVVGRNYTGGLIGRIENTTSEIYHSFITGSVVGDNYVGSLVGYAYGTNANRSIVSDCYSTAVVTSTILTGTPYVGGMFGYLYYTNLSNSYFTGSVYTAIPSNYAGAIAGNAAGGTLVNNYWNTETAQLTRAGTGTNRTTAQMLTTAGFTGFDFEDVWGIDTGNSYPYLLWEGDEAGEHNLPTNLPPRDLVTRGGTGVVNLTWTAPNADFGVPEGYNLYRDEELVNQDGLIEETQYQDEGLGDWLILRYHVTAVYGEGEDVVESRRTNTAMGYTVRYPDGTGVQDNPYLITNFNEFNGMRYATASHFRLTNDINLAGVQWEPIGSSTDLFTGSLDGNGYEIRNLTRASSMNYFGIFSYTGTGAVIENIKLRDVDVYANGSSGTLVGNAAGTTFRNCSATGRKQLINSTQGGLVGTTSGDTSFYRCWVDMEIIDNGSGGRNAGIVGQHNATGSIEECYAIIDLSSKGANNPAAAGLVGALGNGSISNCYAIGTIRSSPTPTTTGQYGGLVGSNSNREISNCYAVVNIEVAQGTFAGLVVSGTAARVQNSYWDREATRLDASPGGGEARMTRQMAHWEYDWETTYVGWDFDDVWSRDIEDVNNGYPVLAYQIEVGELDTPVVSIETDVIDGVSYAKLQWEAIDNANSYIVYASVKPDLPFEDWEEIDRVDETHYLDAIDLEDTTVKFYRVVASAAQVPDGRAVRSRRTVDNRK